MRALITGKVQPNNRGPAIRRMDRTRFSSLEELGLGLSGSALSKALEPFLGKGPGYGEARWQAEIALRRRRLFKRAARRVLARWIGGGRRMCLLRGERGRKCREQHGTHKKTRKFHYNLHLLLPAWSNTSARSPNSPRCSLRAWASRPPK